MPSYVYHCPECGHEIIVPHGMHSNPDVYCSLCFARMKRRPQRVGVNWNGLRPSQGFIRPDVKRFIDDAPRRREEG